MSSEEESDGENEDIGESPRPSAAQKTVTQRRFIGFDDDDDFTSDSEEEQQEADVADDSPDKGKGRA